MWIEVGFFLPKIPGAASNDGVGYERRSQDMMNVYFIWGLDDAPYGPVELPALIGWIRDERVLPDTWIFSRLAGNWQRAADLPELRRSFHHAELPDIARPFRKSIAPASLRRIKILGELKDVQLAHLAEFIEMQDVPQWTVIFQRGDHSDAMYLVVAGEFRARTMSAGKETILTTYGPGDFFGDTALLDQSPRSMDVLANANSTLLKLTVISFERLTHEAPALATPFLQATARTLAAHLHADHKRHTHATQRHSANGGT